MPIARVLLTIAPLVLFGLPALAQAEHQVPGLRLTPETLEYCQTLARRLDAMPGHAQPTPYRLGQEGRRLCARGHLKTGIARLRRAIRITASQQSEGG